MPNSTVPAANDPWTKIDDLSADLARISDLIEGARMICEGDCACAVLAAASNQLTAVRGELAKILEEVTAAKRAEEAE
jgi:hypothetical protein